MEVLCKLNIVLVVERIGEISLSNLAAPQTSYQGKTIFEILWIKDPIHHFEFSLR